MSGPSHASSHSSDVQRRLPSAPHKASASAKSTITAGRTPGRFGYSSSSTQKVSRTDAPSHRTSLAYAWQSRSGLAAGASLPFTESSHRWAAYGQCMPSTSSIPSPQAALLGRGTTAALEAIGGGGGGGSSGGGAGALRGGGASAGCADAMGSASGAGRSAG